MPCKSARQCPTYHAFIFVLLTLHASSHRILTWAPDLGEAFHDAVMDFRKLLKAIRLTCTDEVDKESNLEKDEDEVRACRDVSPEAHHFGTLGARSTVR